MPFKVMDGKAKDYRRTLLAVVFFLLRKDRLSFSVLYIDFLPALAGLFMQHYTKVNYSPLTPKANGLLKFLKSDCRNYSAASSGARSTSF